MNFKQRARHMIPVICNILISPGFTFALPSLTYNIPHPNENVTGENLDGGIYKKISKMPALEPQEDAEYKLRGCFLSRHMHQVNERTAIYIDS